FAEEHAILGPWSWKGKWEESISLKDGIINKMGADHVVVAKGTGIENGNDLEMEEAIRVAKSADAVILAIGEHFNMSGEGGSRAFITIPGRQEELVNKILDLRKPTAVVLFNGRPLEIRELYNHAPAILEAWYPGTEGGNALADIIFGDINPTGKLTISFPYTVGQIPIYYNAFNTGRPNWTDNIHDRFSTHFIDIPNSPLLPFGYGLSYSKFYYSYINIDNKILTHDGIITVSVKIKNTSNVVGTEIVQLYIRDLTGSVVRPVKELKGFKRVTITPSEEQEVLFVITEDMLRFYNSRMEYISEKGKFVAMIGPNSKELQSVEFELI
ncbi:MAG: beta-glucosidase, partial [Haloplasmataceae bacterium]|nr:beta-glucosidase [Haloplasmataceae bacterium]